MAGLFIPINTGSVTVSASTAKSVLMITAPTNQRVRWHNLCVSFGGTSGTDNPALIQIRRATTAGTFTSLTLVKNNSDDDETIQTTAGVNASTEPTKTDVLREWTCHPQGNLAWELSGGGRDLFITGGERFVVEITLGAAPSSTTVRVTALIEE